MTRTLILHIGNHKTGSTSIQLALSKEKNPEIFNHAMNEKHHDKLKSWYGNSWILKNNKTKFSSAFFHADLADALKEHNPDGNVIFSAEDASWVFAANEIEKFADSLQNGFDKIRVIAYLRRQDRNIVSLHQQGLCSNSSRIRRFMNSDAMSLPAFEEQFDLYFNYDQRFRKWADAFGEEAIELHVFKEAVRDQGIVAHFSEVSGVHLKNTSLHVRKSMPKTLQLLKHKLRQMELEVELPEYLSPLLDNNRKALPKREEAIEFYLRYRESNRLLNSWANVNQLDTLFDEDFCEYPLEGADEWDGESAEQAITTLVLLLADLRAQHDASLQIIERQKRRLAIARSKV